ncbi:chlorite dismutase family protein, partial [Pseudokineococcus marinus]|uniref:chlorite dismutase family protein n=1 Tax=Pseudokineococcus marinus TaxID=351215 RepID=UPI001487D347
MAPSEDDADGEDDADVEDDADDEDVVVRGLYDVSGLRADSDLMVWWHAPTVEALQGTYHRLRR